MARCTRTAPAYGRATWACPERQVKPASRPKKKNVTTIPRGVIRGNLRVLRMGIRGAKGGKIIKYTGDPPKNYSSEHLVPLRPHSSVLRDDLNVVNRSDRALVRDALNPNFVEWAQGNSSSTVSCRGISADFRGWKVAVRHPFVYQTISDI